MFHPGQFHEHDIKRDISDELWPLSVGLDQCSSSLNQWLSCFEDK